MTQVRLELAAPQSRVKLSTTEALRSLVKVLLHYLVYVMKEMAESTLQ